MSETRRTITFAAAAVALAIVALLTSPRRVTPDAFLDRGEQFFPDFSDPNAATTLEVIEFDEETATGRPFKVTFKDGRWTIPSHHDYPADARDRLARTAAGVIGITKDDFRTDNVADHEACGVIDPLDEGVATLKGRGKRVTIRGQNGQVLADFIVGRELEDRPGFRFVRLPDQKRVYVAKMDIDISSRFEDWIDRDLLRVDRAAIDQVVLRDYSIDERTGLLDNRDTVVLTRRDGRWSANRTSSGREVDEARMSALLTAIDELSIVGVRPKPAGLTEGLRRVEDGLKVSQSEIRSLRSKGFYFTRDGRLVSNEGELEVRTTDGVVYTMRFGEIVYGRGEAVTAGTGSDDDQTGAPGENRYLFITTRFDPDLFPEPRRPANLDFQTRPEDEWTDADRRNKELHDAHEEWRRKVDRGSSLSRDLNDRFARWYYVIDAGSFDAIHLRRGDLVKRKGA
ncbi:MAG: DUF4340 domain-containing protein [Acidobacteriota bacterium]